MIKGRSCIDSPEVATQFRQQPDKGMPQDHEEQLSLESVMELEFADCFGASVCHGSDVTKKKKTVASRNGL